MNDIDLDKMRRLFEERYTKKEKKPKYKAKHAHCGLHKHMSRAESECCCFLQMMERAKQLTILDTQPNVVIKEVDCKIIPDWKLRYADGREVYADYKGAATPSWRTNRKIWARFGPLPMEVWVGNKAGRFWVSETIKGKA